jgi:hypothetical protein
MTKPPASQTEGSKTSDFEAELAKLSPEQADMFLRALELTLKKRRVMLVGYIAAALAIIIGFGWALYMFGTHQRGTFIGWVFLVPFASAGALFILFGKLAARIKK